MRALTTRSTGRVGTGVLLGAAGRARTARLFDVESAIYSDKLPKLLDARLMAMSPQALTLTGFERVAEVEYAKSWLVSNFGRAE